MTKMKWNFGSIVVYSIDFIFLYTTYLYIKIFCLHCPPTFDFISNEAGGLILAQTISHLKTQIKNYKKMNVPN